MQLPNILKKDAEEAPPRFLAIELQEDYVKTALWQVVDRQIEVVSVSPQRSYSDPESLLTAADESLANVINGFTPEPNQVVFGLPEDWINQDKIVPTFAALIKELVTKLELQPLGFVAVSEAVLQHLKRTEGIPPSVILLEISLSKIAVSLVKLGQVSGRELVGRSDDLGKDVEEGLARIGADQLPARIILLGGQITPDMVQQLNSYPWLDRLPFLHLPKVETPPGDVSVRAVAVSGGSEAARSQGLDIEDLPLNQIPSPPEISPKSPLQRHGFLTRQDIRRVDTEGLETAAPEDSFPSAPGPVAPAPQPLRPASPRSFKFPGLPPFLKAPSLPHLPRSLSAPRVPLKLAAVIVPLLLLLLGAAGVFAYFSFASAVITLNVAPRPLEKTLSVNLTESPSDPRDVPVSFQTIETDESGTISTTGEATVGDKAVGEVTLLNKTDTPRELKAGTVLTSDNNLSVILNDSVSIASRSAKEVNDSNGLGQLIVYGQTKGSVTASKIGSQYNLADGASLSVANFTKSSLEAKVVNGLTGGSSRTVKAVSQKDRDDLLDQVRQTAIASARDRLQSTPSDLAAPLGEVEITNSQFSHGVGEEADTLSLSVSARLHLARFTKDALDQAVNENLKPEIPVGSIPSSEFTSYQIESVTSSDGKYVAKVHVSSKLIPDLNQSDYISRLAGKSVVSANEFLRNIEGYRKVTILVDPPLPILSRFLPRNAGRITLTIVPE